MPEKTDEKTGENTHTLANPEKKNGILGKSDGKTRKTPLGAEKNFNFERFTSIERSLGRLYDIQKVKPTERRKING